MSWPPKLSELLRLCSWKALSGSDAGCQAILGLPPDNLQILAYLLQVFSLQVLNTLPLHIRQTQSLSTFRRHLKTHYFHLAYPATKRLFTNAPWFCSFRLWRFTNHLLTYLHANFILNGHSLALVINSYSRSVLIITALFLKSTENGTVSRVQGNHDRLGTTSGKQYQSILTEHSNRDKTY